MYSKAIKNMKTYKLQHNIGKAKYVVSHNDGTKTHDDGSLFYDIAIFNNKKDVNNFINNLKNCNHHKDIVKKKKKYAPTNPALH